MFKQLLEDKLETISKLGEGINEILNLDVVSEITDDNKPFYCEILPNSIGLDNLKVDERIYKYKGNTHTCEMRKLRMRRNFSLNNDFNSLEHNEKQSILDVLIPELKENFTHIYKIIEIRNSFIVSGYVENHISYICYGNRVGY